MYQYGPVPVTRSVSWSRQRVSNHGTHALAGNDAPLPCETTCQCFDDTCAEDACGLCHESSMIFRSVNQTSVCIVIDSATLTSDMWSHHPCNFKLMSS